MGPGADACGVGAGLTAAWFGCRLSECAGMTTILYAFHKKIQGNVCTDWRLTHDLTTDLETADGKDARVNTEVFKDFLNPTQLQGSVRGSCQGAGYTWKQLNFSAWVKSPPDAKRGVAAIL